MKNINHLLTVIVILISVMIIFDHGFSSFTAPISTQMPVQTESTALSADHTLFESDHYFQRINIFDSDIRPISNLIFKLSDQKETDPFHSAVWQPPKQTC